MLSTVAQNVFAFERYLFAAAYTNFNNFVKYLREEFINPLIVLVHYVHTRVVLCMCTHTHTLRRYQLPYTRNDNEKGRARIT